jgi:uncharacterized membrane protein YhaH (DUF805 family)
MAGEDMTKVPVGVPVRVGLLDAVSRCWRGSFSTQGRASRSEYWWFQLFVVVFVVVVALIESRGSTNGLITLVVFVLLIPAIVSVTVRRLHDGGYSGAWFLVQYVPFIGPFWLLVLVVQPSQRLRNAWGPGPDSHLVER